MSETPEEYLEDIAKRFMNNEEVLKHEIGMVIGMALGYVSRNSDLVLARISTQRRCDQLRDALQEHGIEVPEPQQ